MLVPATACKKDTIFLAERLHPKQLFRVSLHGVPCSFCSHARCFCRPASSHFRSACVQKDLCKAYAKMQVATDNPYCFVAFLLQPKMHMRAIFWIENLLLLAMWVTSFVRRGGEEESHAKEPAFRAERPHLWGAWSSPVNTADTLRVLKMLALSSVLLGSLMPLKSGWR